MAYPVKESYLICAPGILDTALIIRDMPIASLTDHMETSSKLDAAWRNVAGEVPPNAVVCKITVNGGGFEYLIAPDNEAANKVNLTKLHQTHKEISRLSGMVVVSGNYVVTSVSTLDDLSAQQNTEIPLHNRLGDAYKVLNTHLAGTQRRVPDSHTPAVAASAAK